MPKGVPIVAFLIIFLLKQYRHRNRVHENMMCSALYLITDFPVYLRKYIMSISAAQSILVVKSRAKANFPFSVQVQNTENWSTTEVAVTLAAAEEGAKALLERHPKLPIRIEHATGGISVVTTLPVFRIRDRNEKPHRMALWSGKNKPPAIGDTVKLTFNGLGVGTVTGYAVEDGYLGVMVQLNEATRPAWHKESHPTNKPSLVFGCEILNG